MSWSDKVFLYCERGSDPSIWAEPWNAASNVSFLLAAGGGAWLLNTQANTQVLSQRERLTIWGLIALVASIGVGSFIFHTFATRWALIADVGPITLFMVAYLAFALRNFLAVSWFWIAGILPLFVYSGSVAGDFACPSVFSGRSEPCLNGSLGYLPALVALWAIGFASTRRGHRVGRWLLAAGGMFLISIICRTIDRDFCEQLHVGGHQRGTHALWHLLNGLTLYLLLGAAILHSGKRSHR